MKILAKVVESEFLTREFLIDCGLGNQHVSWLAMTACLKFGQEHYPKGIYIPNLLIKDDGDGTVPHPRMRIQEALADGDTVIIKLKNRAQKILEDEQNWYEQAFGAKQNIMNVRVDFTPENIDQLKKGKFDIYAIVNYQMFEELAEEFEDQVFESKAYKLNPVQYEPGHFYFRRDFDWPYGDFTAEIKYAEKPKDPNVEQEIEYKNLPENEKNIEIKKEPIPISLAKLKEMHILEEEENKKREQEARLAQKRLEEEKARLRYEQQQQIAKQEQNTAQLKVYFEAMNLGFHTGDEDFNASMSVLSIYHQELMDNFLFYSMLNPQKFNREENKVICLQQFIHFIKLMGIANKKEEASASVECMIEIEGVNIPFVDTLNVMNGLNYAQFLEAILRITYYKKDVSPEQRNNPDGFKNTLEAMFADADLDLKKRARNDQVLQKMLEVANNEFFRQNFELLAGIFTERGLQNKESFVELSKKDLALVLKEADCLISQKVDKKEAEDDKKKGAKPAEKKPEEEQKAPNRKYDENDLFNSIESVCLFDDDQLGYVNFLEALVRLAMDFPFTEEEAGEYVAFEMRMIYFIQRLENKFKSLSQIFKQKTEQRTIDCQYQGRIVIDEDDDVDYDDL